MALTDAFEASEFGWQFRSSVSPPLVPSRSQQFFGSTPGHFDDFHPGFGEEEPYYFYFSATASESVETTLSMVFLR